MISPSNSHFSRATLAIASLTLAAASLSAALYAQAAQPHVSTLPATAPTAMPAPNTLPAPIAATPDTASTAPKSTPHRATVTYAAGLLDVRADDSSLNQILLSISELTGMTITGGVVDERVFGNYGPATPGTILATLLGGTNSNMLLHESTGNTPSELILTPRSGSVTPPGPSIFASEGSGPNNNAASSGPPERAQPPLPQRFPRSPQQTLTSGPPSIPQPLNDVNGSPANTSPTASTYPTTHSVPLDNLPTPSTTPTTTGIVDAPNPPPPDSTTGTTPVDPLTPPPASPPPTDTTPPQ